MRELVLAGRCIVVVVTDLDRPIGRQHLGACIGLEPEYRLFQEGMLDLALTFDGDTIVGEPPD